MKRILKYMFFLSISHILSTSVQAQWQHIGWQGGAITIVDQLDGTLYGSSGNGFYKSNDSGKTWQIFLKGLPTTSIYGSVGGRFNADGDFLYLNPVFQERWPRIFKFGVYFCKRGDSSWSFKEVTPVNSLDSIGYHYVSIYFISGDTMLLYNQNSNFLPDSTAGCYLSSNSGRSWNKMKYDYPYHSKKKLYAIDFQYDSLKKNNNYQLLKSDDLGKTWQTLSVPSTDTSYFRIHLLTDSVIYTEVMDGYGLPPYNIYTHDFYRSSDKGITWKKTVVPLPNKFFNFNVYELSAFGNKTFLTIEYPDTEGYYKLFISKDTGSSWTKIPIPLALSKHTMILPYGNQFILSCDSGYFLTDSNFSNFEQISFNKSLSNSGYLLYVTGKNLYASKIPNNGNIPSSIYCDSLIVSPDNGETWSTKKIIDDHSFNHVKWYKDETILYASGKEKSTDKACIFQSTDDGNTWNIYCTLSSFSDITELFIHDDTLIVKLDSFNYDNSKLWISIDHGKSWLISSTPYDIGGGYFNFNYIDGFLVLNLYYVSTDLGTTWTHIPSQDMPFSIGSNFVLGNTWFQGFSGVKNGDDIYELSYSTNQGRDWINSEGIDSNLFCYPTLFENNILYAPGFSPEDNYPNNEGRNALFYSLDSGKNWKQLGEYYTDATHIYSGSDYFFMAGNFELWRFPKLALPLSVKTSHQNLNLSVSLLPNPASITCTIIFDLPIPSSAVLKIFSSLGNCIQQINITKTEAGTHQTTVDLSSFTSGAYFVQLSACGLTNLSMFQVVK